MKKLLLALMLFFVSITGVYASNYDDAFYGAEKIKDIYIKKVSKDKTQAKQPQFIRKKSDDGIGYCTEPFEVMKYNENYKSYSENQEKHLGISKQAWDKITKIAYYGYGYKNHKEDKWYSITQIMIWRVIEPDAEFYFTDKLNGKKIDIYDKEIKQIEKLVEQHNKVPSFSFDDLTFSINSTNTLTDSGKVLEDYEIESKSDNIDVKISGNKMTVTTHDESASFIKLKRKENYNRPSVVFIDNKHQNIMTPGKISKIDITIKVNVKSGTIKINKLDLDTNKKFPQGEGALIGSVYNIYDSNNKIVDTLVIDNNYEATSIKLPFGKYIIKESKSMQGYKLDLNEYEVVLDKNNTHKELNLKNEVYKGKIEIYKYYDEKLEEGVSFEIYNKEGKKVKVVTTDKFGKIDITLPYGTYKFHQLNSMKNYKCVDDFTVKIDEATKVKRFDLHDEKFSAKIIIKKKDSQTGERIVNGAIFKIYDIQEEKYLTIDHKDEFITINGIIEIENLPAGKYYIEEIKAPAGYKLNKNKIYFEVDDENEFKYEGEIPVLEININNEKEKEEVVPKTGISLIEKDIYILEEDKRKIKLTK